MYKVILILIGVLLLALRLFAKTGNVMANISMNTAEKLTSFFESSNKPSLKARYDTLGRVWEIGYGNNFYQNGIRVKQGDTITLEQAEKLRNFWVEKCRKDVLSVVKVQLNNNQLEALTSFVYNLGIGRLKSSTMLAYINRKQFDKAANEFEKWDNAGGKLNVPGLVKRRLAEKQLFLKK